MLDKSEKIVLSIVAIMFLVFIVLGAWNMAVVRTYEAQQGAYYGTNSNNFCSSISLKGQKAEQKEGYTWSPPLLNLGNDVTLFSQWYFDCKSGNEAGQNVNYLYCSPLIARQRTLTQTGTIVSDKYYTINLILRLENKIEQGWNTINKYSVIDYSCSEFTGDKNNLREV